MTHWVLGSQVVDFYRPENTKETMDAIKAFLGGLFGFYGVGFLWRCCHFPTSRVKKIDTVS